MGTVTPIDSRSVLTCSLVPEALISCCSYLLERIALVWQMVCGWITELFEREAKPLSSFPKPLPEPVLLHILKLSSLEDTVAVRKVNKFFHRAFTKWLKQLSCLDLQWDNIKFRSSEQAKIFSSSLPALRTVSLQFSIWDPYATFQGNTNFLSHNLLKRASQLTALHLKGDSHNSQFGAICDALPQFVNMHEVTLEVNTHENLMRAAKIPQLRGLVINYPEAPSIKAAFDSFAAREQLESLQLPAILVPLETLEKISSFPRLRSVTLISCFGTTPLLQHLFKLPELRELHFRFSSLHGILQELPENRLETLSFVDCTETRERSSYESLARCKSLRRLHLQLPINKPYNLPFVKSQEEVFPNFPQCPTLETLILANIPFNENGTKDLLALIEKLPNLKEIDLRGCKGKIDQEAVKLAAEARSPAPPFLYQLPH